MGRTVEQKEYFHENTKGWTRRLKNSMEQKQHAYISARLSIKKWGLIIYYMKNTPTFLKMNYTNVESLGENLPCWLVF